MNLKDTFKELLFGRFKYRNRTNKKHAHVIHDLPSDIKTVSAQEATQKDIESLGRKVVIGRDPFCPSSSHIFPIRNRKTGRVIMFSGSIEDVKKRFGEDFEIVETVIKDDQCSSLEIDITKGETMRTIKQLTELKFLNLKEVRDPEHHVSGFQFAERRGVDSIAFICMDKDREQFLLNKEYKPPVDLFILGAFGGSLDKDKNPEDIVLDEAREEAGFKATPSDVHLVGKVLVSSQMNQFCYLYIVFVDKDKQSERHPENEVEALATTHWIQWGDEELSKLQEWKPITIISMAHLKGII